MTVGPIAPVIVAAAGELRREDVERLTSVRIKRGVNVVGEAVLRFDDQGYRLSAAKAFGLGDKIEVSVSGGPLFHGIVHSIALEQSANHVPELVVTANEPTHRLTEQSPPRVFERQSPITITKALLAPTNLSIQDTEAFLGNPVIPYLLQNGTSLSLLDELVRTSGALWWFDGPRTIRVTGVDASPDPPVQLEFVEAGESGRLLTFSVRASGGQPQAARARGWDVKTKQALAGKDKLPRPSPESAFVSGARKVAAPAIVTNAGGPSTQGEADKLANALLASARSDVVTGRGTSLVDGRIAPGAAVKVAAAGPASGTYRVTRVEHTYDRRGFHTTFHTGGHRPRGLVDTLGATGGELAARVDGVLVGIVTDLKDPDDLGRVRVRFPVLRQASDEDVVSAWARVASFDAGNGRGATFLPEIDDEVLVAFENGNLRKPVVLGALFGGQNKQPGLATILRGGTILSRRITSRSGHVIELGDEEGKTKMLFKHGKKPYSIEMDEVKQSVVVEATGGEIKLTNGNASITLDKSGKISIEGVTLELKAKADVAVEAVTKATVKVAAGDLSAEGLNSTLKGTVSVTVQGGATAAVKAASVAIN